MAMGFDTGFTPKEVQAMCDGLAAYKKDILLVLADGTLEQLSLKKAEEAMDQVDSAKGKLERRQADFTLNELKVIYFGLDSLKDLFSLPVESVSKKIENCFRAYNVDIQATCDKFKLRPRH